MEKTQIIEGGSREQKHIILDRAITSIFDVRLHATNVLEEIKRTPEEPVSGPCDNVKVQLPSLEEVLDCGPERINRACEEIHKILDEIRSAIF